MSIAEPAIAEPDVADPDLDEQAELRAREALLTPWTTVVWNDPVNLMSYVVHIFREYFGYSRERAQQLMLEVHHDGRSVVATGPREEMERHVQAMHGYGLWATVDRADG